MNWEVEYLPEAESDLKSLDGSQKNTGLKAIKKGETKSASCL